VPVVRLESRLYAEPPRERFVHLARVCDPHQRLRADAVQEAIDFDVLDDGAGIALREAVGEPLRAGGFLESQRDIDHLRSHFLVEVKYLGGHAMMPSDEPGGGRGHYDSSRGARVMTRTYQVISTDGHLEIPPEDFVDYVPEKYRDRTPQRIRVPEGGDAWLVEGQPLIHTGAVLTAGMQVSPRGRSYWLPDGSRFPGAGSPQQRLAEQDSDGIDAEVLFPPVMVRSALSGVSDDDAYLAIVKGYNTFLGEHYCPTAPDRLLGMPLIPNRGIDDAIAELRRCKDMGLKGVALTDFPSGKGVPSPSDDAFWEVALEIDMPIVAHTHFGNPYPPTMTGPQEGSPPLAGPICSRQASQRPMWTFAQLMVARVFDRFPELQIYFAETNAGWLPFAIEQIDENYKIYEHMFEPPLEMLPSEYLANHILFSFILDETIVRDFDRVPVETLMWGSDFPHSVGTYPHSREWLDKAFAEVDPAIRRQVCVDNPVRFFRLDSDAELTATPAA
jgi:predicted TIM-barrel fold metal-dependent hydrolase